MPTRQPGRALAALACVAALVFVWRAGVLPARNVFADPNSHYDFRAVYMGAADLLAGADPCGDAPDQPSKRIAAELGIDVIHTVYYPMVLGTLYAPFGALPFDQARVAWIVFKLVLLAATVLLLARASAPPGEGARWLAVTVLLFAGFETTVREFAIGQANVVILFLLAVASTSLARGHAWLGGAALGATLLLKPIPGMILVGFALRREWRTVAAAVGLIVVVVAASVAVYGLDAHLSCVSATTAVLRGLSRWWANQSLLGFLIHVGVPNQYSTAWFAAPWLVRVLWLASALAVTGAAALVTMRHPRADAAVALSLWLAVGLLVSPRSWDHYWVWLLISVVLVARAVRDGRVSPWLAAITYVLLAYPGQYWHLHPALHHGPQLVLTSSQAWGALMLAWILARLHQDEAASAR